MCKHFSGVETTDGTERSEYAKCDVANGQNAANSLHFNNGKVTCNDFDEE